MWWQVFFVVFVLFRWLVNDLNATNLRFKREDLSHQASFITQIERNCWCVQDSQCDEDGFIITDGAGLYNPRASSGPPKERIICQGGKYPGAKVCCHDRPGEENKPPVTTAEPITITLPPETTSIVPEVRSDKPIPVGRIKAPKCGTPTSGAILRVSSDDDSTPLDGEFPWLAVIYKRMNDNAQWAYHKIGSLIHPRVILTGAHVVRNLNPNQLKVIVNSEIVLAKIGDNKTQERDVMEIIRHRDWSSGTLRNNVALLILQEPYDTGKSNVNTICLRPDEIFENKTCYVAGWGKPKDDDKAPSILKRADLPVVSRSRCEQLLRPCVSPTFVFHESLMCAGGEGKDSSWGDGGGPLVCTVRSNDAMYQVGIVTSGLNCGDVPSLYANVVHQHGWIVARLKEHNINI